jgi:phage protein D
MANDNKHLTPVWIVYIDGKRLDTDHEGALLKIVVSDRLNGIGTCTLLFDTSAVKLRDAGILAMESQISVQMGYKDDVDEVFNGEITGFRIILGENAGEQLEVSCSNVLYRLKHSIHYTTCENKTLSDTLTGILDSYSLTAEMDSFGAAHEFSTQYGMDDYDYLMKAAGMYGKAVYAYGTKVYIKGEITVRTDEIVYEWGKSLVSFSAGEDISRLISSCTFTGWDSKKCQSITGTAGVADVPVKAGGSSDWTAVSKSGSGMWKSVVVADDLYDSDDAKNRAVGVMQNNSWLYAKAEGTGEGNYKLHPGMRVTIKYTGEKFSGEYIADTVTHRFDYEGGYITSFTLKRNRCP